VATGTGAVLRATRQKTGSKGRVVGIDITPAMLSRAGAEIEDRALLNVELREMDGERLDFPEGSFDTVLCSFGLQALSDKPAALRGFYRRPTLELAHRRAALVQRA
jgi:ubiquinone/menaquinone biosynthesis C-methylase UbiE